MKQRLVAWAFILIIVSISISCFVSDPGGGLSLFHKYWDHPQPLFEEFNAFFQTNFPFQNKLKDINISLRLAGGNPGYGDLFLANDGLIQNFQPTADSIVYERNTDKIVQFAHTSSVPVYFMLLPTSCAIYQEQLPNNTPLYNQRKFIDDAYDQFSGHASVIDAYLSLFAARDQYLYLRTENLLTSRGGFTVYQTLSKRLGLSTRPLQEFEITNMAYEYYGKLYDTWGYGGVKPDIISAYRSVKTDRVYRVYHWNRYEEKVYYTLFPDQASVQSGKNCILGGLSPRIEITAYGPGTSSRLLVVGDETALSYLPFLALHYQHITFVDLSLLTQSEIEEIDPQTYDQILFSYSVETYQYSASPADISYCFS